MLRNRLVTRSLPVTMLSQAPVRECVLENLTESDLLIFESKLATMSRPDDLPVLQSRHASESLFHNQVVDLSRTGDNRVQIPSTPDFWESCVAPEHKHLFDQSHIMASASFDGNELHVSFNDFQNMEFWANAVIDLDTKKVLKIQGRHQSGWAIVLGPTYYLKQMQYARPQFYGYMKNNLLNIYDSAIGAESFKIVCDLSKFIDIYNKPKNKKRRIEMK